MSLERKKKLKEKINKYIKDPLVDTYDKLGLIGFLAYIGAWVLIREVVFIDFVSQWQKGVALSFISLFLLFFSGIIYIEEKKQETVVIKRGLHVLEAVFNRVAEQLSTSTTTEKAKLLTKSIDSLPDRIIEIVKKVKIIPSNQNPQK